MTWRDGKMEDEKVIELKEQIASWKKEMDDKKAEYEEIMTYHTRVACYQIKQLEDPLVLDKEPHKKMLKLSNRYGNELRISTNERLKCLRRYIHEYEFRLERYIDKVFWQR